MPLSAPRNSSMVIPLPFWISTEARGRWRDQTLRLPVIPALKTIAVSIDTRQRKYRQRTGPCRSGR